MPIGKAKRNVALLCACQALLLVNNSVLVAVNGLAGYALATDKALATVPVTAYFLGAALATLPLSAFMQRYGRRVGFSASAACAIAGALMCVLAVYGHDFWLLTAGALVLGMYFAGAQYYRFAAAEAVPAELKSTAISLVIAGGIVGGFLGPETSKFTIGWLPGQVYAGAYLSLAGFALAALVLVQWLEIAPSSAEDLKGTGRSLARIAREPAFVVAVLCGVVSYGVMNLLMTATPLAMVDVRHTFSDAAFVIQWHFLAMFLPSLVTGSLIRRLGLLPVMLAGAVLMGGCVTVALSGIDVMHFWLALLLLGVGWNFMYIGATTLLSETHTPAERGKVQGINEAAIFAAMVVSSAFAGALFTQRGWELMNALVTPFLALAAAGLVWLAFRKQPTGKADP